MPKPSIQENFLNFSLYFAYFLFFSPYLLPLLSFLLPLLLSTSLLTLLFHPNHEQLPNPTLITHIFEYQEVDDHENETFYDASEKVESLQRDNSTLRREKEWKRTLACKLYEERMTFKLCEDRDVVDGAEEMDLLWEAYNEANAKKDDRRDDEEEEEEDEEVRLCCLQALRMTTGKMRRPNLEKMTKVFKGFGLFRRGSSRRSRKG